MLIRSQNKCFLIMPDNYKAIIANINGDVLATNVLKGDNHTWSVVRDNGYADCVVLGHYSTHTRAIKVLDMITDAYTAYDYHMARLREFDTDDGFKWEYEPRFAFNPPKVFQMPQDDEVKA